MSLVPDYASSCSSESENEAKMELKKQIKTPVKSVDSELENGPDSGLFATLPKAKTTKKTQIPKKKKKNKKTKTKTTLFLPPEIQKLLETGAGLNDDDSDIESDIGHDQHFATGSKKRKTTEKKKESENKKEDHFLGFLPPPKNDFQIQKKQNVKESKEQTIKQASEAENHVEEAQEHHQQHQEVPAAAQASYTQQEASNNAQYDPNYAYYYQQQQQYQQYQPYYQDHAYATGTAAYPIEQVTTSNQTKGKKARYHERELERALQQGHFDQLQSGANFIEVQGPAPNAWQAPVDQDPNSQNEVKIKASFWSTQAGAAVATAKPSRLQRQRHQLNQLAFDAKSREHELLDRKGVALKTKAETHAKYGW